jgi:hypothetical protein
MSLVPLPVNELQDLLDLGTPSALQYEVYWGKTKRERYDRVFGSCVVGLIGTFFCYFLSFVIGNFVSTILGGIFLFWTILSPDFKA